MAGGYFSGLTILRNHLPGSFKSQSRDRCCFSNSGTTVKRGKYVSCDGVCAVLEVFFIPRIDHFLKSIGLEEWDAYMGCVLEAETCAR